MSRFKAFGIHLGISFVIFIILAYFVVVEWYPGLLFDTDGGWRGMRIIIGVDLVLGPLLTLVAYKAGKPGLKFDLTCIALLQTTCLIAGTWVVWQERPLAIVYVDSRFEVTTQDAYNEAGTSPRLDRFSHLKKPLWLKIELPEDLDELVEVRQRSFASGGGSATLSDLYASFNSKDPKFLSEARDVNVIINRDGGQTGLEQWLSRHGGTIEDYAFYTFSTRYVYRYIGFRRSTGENLGFLDVQPR